MDPISSREIAMFYLSNENWLKKESNKREREMCLICTNIDREENKTINQRGNSSVYTMNERNNESTRLTQFFTLTWTTSCLLLLQRRISIWVSNEGIWDLFCIINTYTRQIDWEAQSHTQAYLVRGNNCKLIICLNGTFRQMSDWNWSMQLLITGPRCF